MSDKPAEVSSTRSGLRDVVEQIIDAWERLPGGRSYSPREIERWLKLEMAPAINAARAAVGRGVPR